MHWISIYRFEIEMQKSPLETREKICTALEAAGVEFKRGGWLRLKALKRGDDLANLSD